MRHLSTLPGILFTRRCLHLITPAFLMTLGVVLQAAQTSAAPRRKTVTMRVAMRDGLWLYPPRQKVNPGDQVTIYLEKADATHQMHNFVLVRQETQIDVVKAALEMGESGPKQQFVPDLPAILAHSDLLAPHKTQRLTFTMPEQPGVHPYVHTFPDHGLVVY
jgi:hypothetical protein